MLVKKKHRVSASGVVTGVNTPPLPPNPSNQVVVVGPIEMPLEVYAEAKRYFELFQAAIRDRYPHAGYSIGLHERTAKCVLKCNDSTSFKFDFQPETIKNHYVSFRLLNDIDNYLAHARSQQGLPNYTNANTIQGTQ